MSDDVIDEAAARIRLYAATSAYNRLPEPELGTPERGPTKRHQWTEPAAGASVQTHEIRFARQGDPPCCRCGEAATVGEDVHAVTTTSSDGTVTHRQVTHLRHLGRAATEQLAAPTSGGLVVPCTATAATTCSLCGAPIDVGADMLWWSDGAGDRATCRSCRGAAGPGQRDE